MSLHTSNTAACVPASSLQLDALKTRACSLGQRRPPGDMKFRSLGGAYCCNLIHLCCYCLDLVVMSRPFRNSTAIGSDSSRRMLQFPGDLSRCIAHFWSPSDAPRCLKFQVPTQTRFGSGRCRCSLDDLTAVVTRRQSCLVPGG